MTRHALCTGIEMFLQGDVTVTKLLTLQYNNT